MVSRSPLQGTDGDGGIDKDSSPAFFLAGMNTDPAQNSGEEVILPIHLKGEVIVFMGDGRYILRGTGMDRTTIFTSDIFLKPVLIWNLDTESVQIAFLHGVLTFDILKSFETPARKSLSRLK